mmetsp:Transcript_29872/g.69044  ORF Transcript_29872/g.69044 Transcript_29872/m.69044 type:complete len:221 (+) Transcript_29872:396-1058(+)
MPMAVQSVSGSSSFSAMSDMMAGVSAATVALHSAAAAVGRRVQKSFSRNSSIFSSRPVLLLKKVWALAITSLHMAHSMPLLGTTSSALVQILRAWQASAWTLEPMSARMAGPSDSRRVLHLAWASAGRTLQAFSRTSTMWASVTLLSSCWATQSAAISHSLHSLSLLNSPTETASFMDSQRCRAPQAVFGSRTFSTRASMALGMYCSAAASHKGMSLAGR